MLKKIQSLLGIAIVILSLFNTSSVALATTLGDRAPKDWGDQFITNANLQDKSGQVKNSSDLYAKDLSAHWYFEIPTGENVAPGDTMTVKVPEVLALQNTTSFNILDESGEIIGTAVASPDTGNVVITFTEAIRNAQKVKISGQFNLDVHWDHQKVNFGETTQIDWTANITSTVQIDEGTDKPDENEGIKKWGYIDAQDPSVIHWTARVNFSENLDTTIKNAIYQDELGPNQELVAGSISGFYVSGWEDNWFAKAGAPIPSEMIDQSDETHFKVTFGDLTGCVYIKGTSNNYQLIHL